MHRQIVHHSIGNIFTPLNWAEFAVQEFDILSKWMKGASIFDPTMGEGNLLEALITSALSKGKKIHELPIHRLFGNEMNRKNYGTALEKFRNKYQSGMSTNFTNQDFLTLKNTRYDIIFGNPPWQNFNDLPDPYKEIIKPYFNEYGLINDHRDLLLGGSRIDIAALIIRRAIGDFLAENGDAFFYMPLSLLLNDGASRNFRTYRIHEVKFALMKVFDFHDEDVFGGVSTRYGLVQFRRDQDKSWPVPYFRLENTRWKKYKAKPLFQDSDPLSIAPLKGKDFPVITQFITLKKESLPRQGINTCGANDVFFFDEYEMVDAQFCRVSNKRNRNIILPKTLVFPLVTAGAFIEKSPQPRKWVLLPYNEDGRAMSAEQMKEHPQLYDYFIKHRKPLASRKGVMIRSMMKSGHWWALLGAGAYNFFPYKIIWEAYGRKHFKPKLFPGCWQANQSLQAFIPVRTKKEAAGTLMKLLSPEVEDYLLSMKMEGTMNWAQPGRIRKIVRVEK